MRDPFQADYNLGVLLEGLGADDYSRRALQDALRMAFADARYAANADGAAYLSRDFRRFWRVRGANAPTLAARSFCLGMVTAYSTVLRLLLHSELDQDVDPKLSPGGLLGPDVGSGDRYDATRPPR